MREFEPHDIIAPRAHLKEWTQWGLVVHSIAGDGTIYAFPFGGGPEYEFDPVRVEEHDFVKVPRKLLYDPDWYQAEFTADWLDGRKYRGWTTGLRWNGWAMPYFEFDEAMRYAMDSGNTRYDPEKDAFVTTFEGQDEPEIDEATVILVKDRGPFMVYPIGAGSWTWSEA